MNQRMRLYTFTKPSVTTNEYNDYLITNVAQDDIYGFISIRTEAEYTSNSFNIDNWQYMMLTKDNRPEKGDIIDGKEVKFIIPSKRYNMLLLQDIS